MYRVKGAERRAFPRYQVELPTEIEFAERFRRHCRITNICTDGALVEWRTSSAEAEPTPAASDHCRLEIRINASGAAPLLAEAQVIHAFDNGFGVRFTRFENNGQIRLQRYLAGLFHGPSGQGTATPADARPLLKKFTLSRLDDLTRMLNQSLSDVLWSAGEAATSDQERALFISAASALARAHAEKRLQDGLRRRLFDAISDWGRASGNGRSDQSGSLPSSLELVDKENFELWLAKAALANHLEKTLEAPLLEMRALVRQAGPHGLPFEPAELTDTIEHTLTALGLETLPCIRCLQGLREDLPEWLDPMYRELASAWLKAGLGRPAATAPEPAPKAAASPDIPRQAPPPTPPSAAPDARAQTEAAPAAAPNRSLAQWLLQQSMQQPASPPGGALALKGQVLQMVAAAAADQAAVALTPQLEERVDASEQLLNNMLDDPALEHTTRSLIQRLSMRFLASAVDDAEFFRTQDHPLVNFIDRLEHLSLFLQEDELRAQVERLIRKLLATDSLDGHQVEAVTNQLANLESELGREFQIKAERIISGCEGRERVRAARRQVRTRLNRAFARKPMHRAVEALIQQGWRTLLQLVVVRDGGRGAQWKQYWELLLDLHAACDQSAPQTLSIDQRKRLMQDLRGGLTYIGYDPFHTSTLLRGVEKALRDCAHGIARDRDYLLFEEVQPDPEEDPGLPDQAAADATPAQWQDALRRADELNPGASLHLQEDGGERSMRLIWKSRDGAEWVFVDPRGHEARTLRRSELAGLLLKNEARTAAAEQQPLSSRSIDTTIREIQERGACHEARDPLTGLKDRRQFAADLLRRLTEETEEFKPQCIAFVDLDHFEAVNTTCGFTAGEKMLVATGKSLEISLEEATSLSYLGGSRFGLMLPAESDEQARDRLELLRASMESLPFFWNGVPYPVTPSIGLVVTRQEHETPEQVLSAADAACRAALSAGGNRVVVFQEENEVIARQKRSMESWIRAERALKEERLRLRGQAIVPVDPAGGLTGHYEVLLSVYDEQGEPMSLFDFITAAEAFKLMDGVDRLVIRMALEWLRDNLHRIERMGGIAINLSGQSLSDPGLVGFIRDNIDLNKLPPEIISFEVTETAAIANLDQAVAIIEGIKSLGCRFALDDFGTGMSSYSYLKTLPVDYLKIDGSFVKDILKSPQDQAIVKSMNEIAHFMGKKTIAEYVENDDILKKLREMGVDFAQGYALEKPVFLDEMGD